jgi:hypothetical protein
VLCGKCRGLLRGVESGYVKSVHLSKPNRMPKWVFVVVKKSGGLRTAEVMRFGRYCWSFQKHEIHAYWRCIVRVTVKVVELERKHVQERCV